MKKLLLSVLAISYCFSLLAQDIKLPAPKRTSGKPLMDCLNERKSIKDFDASKQLTNQQLSNLLWAAWGYNRPEKRTAPSSRNKQEIDIYVALKSGLYLWNAKTNVLKLIIAKDVRKDTGKQPYVEKAAVNLVYVCNITKCDTKGDKQKLTEATYANTGFIAQNVYLFCASEGLGTVIRGYVPKEQLSKTMKLGKDQLIVLAQSVGYGK
ncbi:MAG: SagB/ThcOx family dehydrogenase [Paludibacteraceae bacterium]|nr:SagB/ThcOx family dehydrogenase [Paludibacteraceae bacterium]